MNLRNLKILTPRFNFSESSIFIVREQVSDEDRHMRSDCAAQENLSEEKNEKKNSPVNGEKSRQNCSPFANPRDREKKKDPGKKQALIPGFAQ
jgi:hypothetical protein